MKRFTGIVLSLCMVFMSVGLVSGADFKLSYANFPPASTFPCVQMERWKQEVEKRTNGKVEVQTYPGGTLLGGKNMFRGVMKGQADIGCISLAYQPGVFPLCSVLELPLGLANATVASQVLWEIFTKYQPKEFSRVKVLTMFTSAPSSIMSKEPMRSLADMKGVEIRGAGIASKVLSALGAIPVSMPMPETPEALQKGVVQGLLTSLEVLKDMNFAEYCPYATRTNFQVYPFAVIMNKRKWNALPDDVKKVFNDLGTEQSLWTGKYMDAHVEEALAWSKKNYNLQLLEFSPQDKKVAEQKLSVLTTQWKKRAEDKGIEAEKVLKDVYKLKNKYQK